MNRLQDSAILAAAMNAGLEVIEKREDVGIALCPFHKEKTPSLALFAHNETFLCFGCGKTGNVEEFRGLIGR